MELGPTEPIRECPTCGVDAARAMVVSAMVAFYQPLWECKECNWADSNNQAAANHMATHEPDLTRFVDFWIQSHAPTWRLGRRDPRR